MKQEQDRHATVRPHDRVRMVAIGALVWASSACYLHTTARRLERARRPPTCATAIRVVNSRDEVRTSYIEVARLSQWWPADMTSPGPDYLAEALRNKAAELGATGLILQPGWDAIPPKREAALAIFVPAESAHVAERCR
jgi:hypothetical protein